MKNRILITMKLMQSTLLVLILSLFLISCKNEPKPPTVDEAKVAIMQKIKSANDRWASGDPMGFLECAAQDIVWLDDLGAQKPVCGYEALGKYLETFKGQIYPHEHELLDTLFQPYDDIVIVTYCYQAISDEEPANPWKVTSVYRYQDGDWSSVHENWSVVKQEP
jgi:ketosteroid isomerase-like protein